MLPGVWTLNRRCMDTRQHYFCFLFSWVYRHPMSGQRKATKKQIGFYVEPSEAKGLKTLAASFGMNVSDFLRAVARKEISVTVAPDTTGERRK